MYKVLFVLLLLTFTQQKSKTCKIKIKNNGSIKFKNCGPEQILATLTAMKKQKQPKQILKLSPLPPQLKPEKRITLDSRTGQRSAPSGKGQNIKGDYSVEKDPTIPPQVLLNFNEAQATKIVAKDAGNMHQSKEGINLEEDSKKSLAQETLHYGEHWYAIDLNWPVLDCPQYGFWVMIHGPALVWIKVGNTFYNFLPLYPWKSWQWHKINPPLAKCGNSKVTLYVWTYSHWFNWWIWRPEQNCIGNCK